jgi:hypothetical protein
MAKIPHPEPRKIVNPKSTIQSKIENRKSKIELTLLKKIFLFYYDGFRSMTVGRKLWIIILIKLFILFFVLRLFFFPDFLKSKFSNDKDRGDYVREQLIQRK